MSGNLTLYVARAYLNMADCSEEVTSMSNESYNSEIVPNTNVKTPVWKNFWFPGNREEPKEKLFVVTVQKKCLI